jgi:hypothetical protein
MKKLMELDPEIFIEKYEVITSSATPFTYTVDLSKYENSKIPQDCKEILFRPKKMKRLYEKYWSIASELDSSKKVESKRHQRLRWS